MQLESRSGLEKLHYYIVHEEIVLINKMLLVLLNEISNEDLHNYYFWLEDKKFYDLEDRLFYFFSLYRHNQDFQKRVNEESFSVAFLEGYIIYLMGHYIEIGENRESLFQKYLFFLDEKKLLSLITESDFLHYDVDLFVYILTKLSQNEINIMHTRGEKVQEILIDIFLNFPEDRIGSILSRNSVLFDYIHGYLMDNALMDDAALLQEKYSRVIVNADQIRILVKNLENLNSKEISITSEIRSMRAEKIIMEIYKTDNPIETFKILDYNGLFLDSFEQTLIEKMLTR